MRCCGEHFSAMLEADVFNSFQGLAFLFFVLVLTSLFVHHMLFSGALVSNLQDKHVVITGCDSGFGYQLAVRLDAKGLRVFASCLTRDGEETLRQKCSQRLRTFHLDVTKPETVQRFFEFVKKNLPSSQGLWGIINNAGVVGPQGPVEWYTVDSMKSAVDINLWGTVEMSKTFLPLLKQCKGRIVNVGSVLSRVSLPGAAAYAISKFGVVAFSDALRNEIRPFGVSVHIIEPGFFKTNITDVQRGCEAFQKAWEQLSSEMKNSYGEDFLEEGKKRMTNFLNKVCSSDTSKVVKAMEHALLSTSPKVRYIVGWDNQLFWRPLSFLPSQVQDFVLGILNPKPKSQQTKA